jgi:hypothetical protein
MQNSTSSQRIMYFKKIANAANVGLEVSSVIVQPSGQEALSVLPPSGRASHSSWPPLDSTRRFSFGMSSSSHGPPPAPGRPGDTRPACAVIVNIKPCSAALRRMAVRPLWSWSESWSSWTSQRMERTVCFMSNTTGCRKLILPLLKAMSADFSQSSGAVASLKCFNPVFRPRTP